MNQRNKWKNVTETRSPKDAENTCKKGSRKGLEQLMMGGSTYIPPSTLPWVKMQNSSVGSSGTVVISGLHAKNSHRRWREWYLADQTWNIYIQQCGNNKYPGVDSFLRFILILRYLSIVPSGSVNFRFLDGRLPCLVLEWFQNHRQVLNTKDLQATLSW